MSIEPKTFKNEAEFNNELFKVIQSFENPSNDADGYNKYVHSPTDGIPTVGVGVTLLVKKWDNVQKKNVWGINEKRIELLTQKGITVNDNDKELLRNAAAYMNSGNVTGSDEYINSHANEFSFTISEDKAKELFDAISPEYKGDLKSRLGDELYKKFSNSEEMIALFALEYNNGSLLIGPTQTEIKAAKEKKEPEDIETEIQKALRGDNRAEVWYQIRYESNGGPREERQGVSKVRYQEAALWGIYNRDKDNNPVITMEDVEELNNMYEDISTVEGRGSKKGWIKEYESVYSPTAPREDYKRVGLEEKIKRWEDTKKDYMEQLVKQANIAKDILNKNLTTLEDLNKFGGLEKYYWKKVFWEQVDKVIAKDKYAIEMMIDVTKITLMPPGIKKVIALYEISQRYCDPLTFDLDNDGIETIDIKDSQVYFDLDNDTFKERTGWVSANDGILFVDENNNNNVDGITELFGNTTINGFEELKLSDTNHDGKIDVNDANFSKMKIWQDLNENGISEAGELKTLSELSIKSINLNYSAVYQENNGNIISEISTFEMNDGTIKTIADLNFAIDQVNTIVNNIITINTNVLFLPCLRGYGIVKDLPLAMTDNKELLDYVDALANSSGSLTEIYEAMDEFLTKWAGVEDVDPEAMRGMFNARKLAVLEKFMGQEYLSYHMPNDVTPNVRGEEQTINLENAYSMLKNMYFAHFAMQSILADTFGDAYYYLPKDEMVFPADTTEILNSVVTLINESDEYEAGVLSLVLSTLKTEGSIDLSSLNGRIDQQWYDVISGAKHLVLGTMLNNDLSGRSDNDLIKPPNTTPFVTFLNIPLLSPLSPKSPRHLSDTPCPALNHPPAFLPLT